MWRFSKDHRRLQSDSDLRVTDVKEEIRVQSFIKNPKISYTSAFDDAKENKIGAANQRISTVLQQQHAKQMDHGASKTPPPRLAAKRTEQL